MNEGSSTPSPYGDWLRVLLHKTTSCRNEKLLTTIRVLVKQCDQIIEKFSNFIRCCLSDAVKNVVHNFGQANFGPVDAS